MFEDIIGNEQDYTKPKQPIGGKLYVRKLCNGKVNGYSQHKDIVYINYIDLNDKQTYNIAWPDVNAFLNGWTKPDLVEIEFPAWPGQSSVSVKRLNVKTKAWDTIDVVNIVKI
jgi:hypothetical protein